MTQAQLDAVRELDFEHTVSEAGRESLYPDACPECDGSLVDGHCEFCNGVKPEDDDDEEFSDEQLRDAWADHRYECMKDDRLMRGR